MPVRTMPWAVHAVRSKLGIARRAVVVLAATAVLTAGACTAAPEESPQVELPPPGGTEVTPSFAQDVPGPTERQVEYSPYPGADYPNRAFFGDTHLHTWYSADAGMVGAILGPDEAYRFARGEEVTSNHGLPARLQRG